MIYTQNGHTKITGRELQHELEKELTLGQITVMRELARDKQRITLTADLTCILSSLIESLGKQTAVKMWSDACTVYDSYRAKENNENE